VPGAANTLLWLVDSAALSGPELEAGLCWLGQAERLRHARFVRAERRRQFVAGRVLLRRALGALLGVAPRTVELLERPGNAPALVFPELPGLGLSISHSGRWVACAVSLDAPVGLDIERIDATRDVVAIAEQAFGAEAAAQLAALDGAGRLQAFYRRWCRYEAHIKLGSEPGPGGAHDHVFELPGLALVLSSTRALEVEPAVIDTAGFMAAA
jgi:4'-phosphopantetheinyl transferase